MINMVAFVGQRRLRLQYPADPSCKEYIHRQVLRRIHASSSRHERSLEPPPPYVYATTVTPSHRTLIVLPTCLKFSYLMPFCSVTVSTSLH